MVAYIALQELSTRLVREERGVDRPTLHLSQIQVRTNHWECNMVAYIALQELSTRLVREEGGVDRPTLHLSQIQVR